MLLFLLPRSWRLAAPCKFGAEGGNVFLGSGLDWSCSTADLGGCDGRALDEASAGMILGDPEDEAGETGDTKVSTAGAAFTSPLWYSGVGGRCAPGRDGAWPVLVALVSLWGEREWGRLSFKCLSFDAPLPMAGDVSATCCFCCCCFAAGRMFRPGNPTTAGLAWGVGVGVALIVSVEP